MINEVKEKWIKLMGGTVASHQTLADKIYWFLEQFEGYRLVKDDPEWIGWRCDHCGQAMPGKVEPSMYHDINMDMVKWLCKSCFDKQCPEPAAKPRYQGGMLNPKTREMEWHDLPTESAAESANSQADRIERHRMYFWDGMPDGVNMVSGPALIAAFARDCELRERPDDIPEAEGLRPVRWEDGQWRDAEPEPWAEFKAACQRRNIKWYEDVPEAWWKEHERRVSRMIAAAIKAERRNICNSLLASRNDDIRRCANRLGEATCK